MKFLAIVLAVMLMSGGVVFAIEPQIQSDITIKQRIEIEGVDAKYSAQNYNIGLPLKYQKLSITPSVGLTVSQLDVSNVDLDSGIGWNIGFDAEYSLYEGVVNLSAIGSYRLSRVDIDEIAGVSNPYETILLLNEYEAGLRVSKAIGAVNPYISLVYSGIDGEIDTPFNDLDVEEKDNVGLRLGLSSSPTDNLQLALQVAYLDKTAIQGKVSYKF